MHCMMLFIAAFCLALSSGALAAVHGGLVCIDCHHQGDGSREPVPAKKPHGCAVCHTGYDRIFQTAMAHRTGEKQFVQRSYARFDSDFWSKNCDSCHLKSCQDCHDGLLPSKPSVAACQKCHKGYYTGWDYSGRAPRDDCHRSVQHVGSPCLMKGCVVLTADEARRPSCRRRRRDLHPRAPRRPVRTTRAPLRWPRKHG